MIRKSNRCQTMPVEGWKTDEIQSTRRHLFVPLFHSRWSSFWTIGQSQRSDSVICPALLFKEFYYDFFFVLCGIEDFIIWDFLSFLSASIAISFSWEKKISRLVRIWLQYLLGLYWRTESLFFGCQELPDDQTRFAVGHKYLSRDVWWPSEACNRMRESMRRTAQWRVV